MAAHTFLSRFRCVVYTLYVAMFGVLVVHVFDPDALQEKLSEPVHHPIINHTLLPNNVTPAEALLYVPESTVRRWGERNFLLVFGIPTVDVDGRKRRRNLQRTTCWRYPGVATRANGYTGDMLVLYLLARHPMHNYEYSAALEEEAAEWHDVLALPMNEGRVSTKKRITGRGFWGPETEIGMSRKVFLWFNLALRIFPTASYVAKGDDDMFLRVPQYLTDLRKLPRRRVYWGAFVGRGFIYADGPCYTLARDVAEAFASYEPVRQLVATPYTKDVEQAFLSLHMGHEDAMVGFVLKTIYSKSVLYVKEKRCSFYNMPRSGRSDHLTKRMVMVHHISESMYAFLIDYFRDGRPTAPRRFYVKRSSLMFPCYRPF